MSLYIGSLMALCFLFVHVLLVCSWQFDTVHHWVCFNVVVGYCYVHVKSDFIAYRKRSRFMLQTTGTHNTSMSMSKKKHRTIRFLAKKNRSVQKMSLLNNKDIFIYLHILVLDQESHTNGHHLQKPSPPPASRMSPTVFAQLQTPWSTGPGRALCCCHGLGKQGYSNHGFKNPWQAGKTTDFKGNYFH